MAPYRGEGAGVAAHGRAEGPGRVEVAGRAGQEVLRTGVRVRVDGVAGTGRGIDEEDHVRLTGGAGELWQEGYRDGSVEKGEDSCPVGQFDTGICVLRIPVYVCIGHLDVYMKALDIWM